MGQNLDLSEKTFEDIDEDLDSEGDYIDDTAEIYQKRTRYNKNLKADIVPAKEMLEKLCRVLKLELVKKQQRMIDQRRQSLKKLRKTEQHQIFNLNAS